MRDPEPHIHSTKRIPGTSTVWWIATSRYKFWFNIKIIY